MLEVRGVNVSYGKIQALWDVSIEVPEGQIVGIFGANGAGKTTLLNVISGLMRPLSGEVWFMGRKIHTLETHRIVRLGISHIPEGGRLFEEMTIRENLEMGSYAPSAWRRRQESLREVYQIFPKLKEREDQLAKTLSGGERQMLAIARGLMSRPRLLMCDEPSFGLAPLVIIEFFRIIKSLKERGLTVLLVEQNIARALEIVDRAYLIENGRIVFHASSSDFLQNEYVRKAYLGY